MTARLVSIILLCGVLAFAVVTFAVLKPGYLIGHLGISEATNISLYASALEDLIFFAFIGIFLFLVSLPKEQSLAARFENIYKSKEVNLSLKQELIKKATQSAVYSPVSEVVARVSEYNAELDAYRVDVAISLQLASAIPDSNFSNSRPITFDFDDLGDMKGQPYGELLYVTQHTSENPNPEPVVKPFKFMQKSESFSIKEESPRGVDISYLVMGYWLWCKTGEVFGYKLPRLTEKFSLSLENEMEVAVPYLFKGEERELKAGRTDKLANADPMIVQNMIEFILKKQG